MARVRVCDFCGKVMKHSGCLIVKEYMLGMQWERVDVCEKCADKIKWYIHNTADTRGEE